LTGSYRQEDVLELWDIRTFKKIRTINWNGPKAETVEGDMEEEKKEGEIENPNLPSEDTTSYNRENPAPFIYSAMFNN